MKSVLEGLLFVVGDEGLSIDEISSIIERSKEETITLLEELNHDYEDENRGIEIKKLGEKYKLTTKEKNKKYYQISQKIQLFFLFLTKFLFHNFFLLLTFLLLLLLYLMVLGIFFFLNT